MDDFVWGNGLGDASVPTLLHAAPAPTGVVVRGDGLGDFIWGDGLGDASVPTLLHATPAPTGVVVG